METFSIWTEQGKDRKSASKSCRVHHVKRQTEWITSWNQDCWQKYQQTQICRWCHYNERKWRGTKEPVGECERGEWKSWLKTTFKIENHGIWSHHFMANRWDTVETVTYFIFLGSKVTADSFAALKLMLWQS